MDRYQEITINGATYIVHDDGSVYGSNGNKIMQRLNADGYASFTAGRKGQRIRVRTHQIVGKLFVPNPLGLPELDHIDGDRTNPDAGNLEWVTHQENIRRAKAKGNYKGRYVGTLNPRCNLTESDVLNIRASYANGMTQMEISKRLGVPWSTVHNIVTRNTWKHV